MPPDLSTFRLFDCRAYVPLPDAKRRKFDKKTQPCILLCFGEGSTYRVFLPYSDLLQVVRHVRCDETEVPGYGPVSDVTTRIDTMHFIDGNGDKTSSTPVGAILSVPPGPEPASSPLASSRLAAEPSTTASAPETPSPPLTAAQARRLVTYAQSHAAPSRRSERISSMPEVNMNEETELNAC